LPRKRLFQLQKRRCGALAGSDRDEIDQINACEKPAFHRGFCDVQNLRRRYARARKNFCSRALSLLSIKEFAAMARGTYTQY